MKIQMGEHAVAIGQTGSGKTFFVKNGILPAYNRIIVLDTEELQFDEFPAVTVSKAISLAKSNYSFYVRIVMHGNMDDDAEALDELCRGLLDYGHDLVIYIDEITDFSTPNSIPSSLLSLIRKARKRSISVICGTQRPQLLNKSFLVNSVHQFYFYVDDYDAAYLHRYAPFLSENLSEIPYGSYMCIYYYHGEITIIEPVDKYNWNKRVGRK
jgi:energy-coupling factor transporter ATP-binding protein EcfA2